ncbi:PREDICTED: uncharacterized protein LOC104742588 [Camelina sativa]|uniref:Uncharacterized protein LOC104742588 n=1 Tax=Camelina sativa TaxID=90675 RepID=A0ABM0VW25_CAMSA|nr:PREDICTED: uncharacterized protein LOC104742588 [Camelina sativa]
MGYRALVCVVGPLFLILFTIVPYSTALISSPESNPPYPKAISDLKESIVKGFGFQSEEVKISGFDVRDALVGHAVSYEFDLEIDNKVLPFRLLEDVNRWEYVDLPIFHVEQPVGSRDENGVVPVKNKKKSNDVLPVLAPFQLAGPMELWIQDANNMRLSLPYDVDAGVLKKVILADGAVVTVKGARSVSLRHPIDLSLPLNQSSNEFASGLLSLAEQLRRASSSDQETPLLSLRIVGPTSLASTSQSPDNKLKLKRLAPGLVELSSMSKTRSSLSTVDGAMTIVLTPREFTTMWPVTSINGSNANLLGFEKLLTSVLGSKAQEKGSFKVLKADVGAQTYMKIGFGVEKKLKEADLEGLRYPEWRTKPETMRMHFEVLAKVDGEKVIPENVMRVDPIPIEDTVAQNVIAGNVTMSIPMEDTFQPPPSPFTL